MIPAARQIQDVTGSHAHRLHQGAAGLLVIGARIGAAAGHCDGRVGAGLIQLPGLFAADVDGEDVVQIEMGAEGLDPAERGIGIGPDRRAESSGQHVGQGRQFGRQRLDVVGDQTGPRRQEDIDPGRGGAQHLASRGADPGAILVRRYRCAVTHQFQIGGGPDRALGKQAVEPAPVEDAGLGPIFVGGNV